MQNSDDGIHGTGLSDLCPYTVYYCRRSVCIVAGTGVEVNDFYNFFRRFVVWEHPHRYAMLCYNNKNIAGTVSRFKTIIALYFDYITLFGSSKLFGNTLITLSENGDVRFAACSPCMT